MPSQGNVTAPTAPSHPVPDGTRFVLAAPEETTFPGEELPVLRALDSFVFILRGNPIPLSNGWLQNDNWAGIEAVGAVATITGPTAALAQCGWITRLRWRWIRITEILHVQIRLDSRFRKGEPCFWLTTRMGEYVIFAPHRGYSTAWNKAISQPEIPTPVPTFRRMSERDPMPTWWDPAWAETWPPSVPEPPSGQKRAAPTASKPNVSPQHLAEDEANSPDEERRVRRRDSAEVIVKSPLADRQKSDPPKSRNPTLQLEETLPSDSNSSTMPRLGVVMSRAWDVTRDSVEKPPANPNPKSQQAGNKIA